MTDESFGLYLHIPFCLRRCAYCDFPSTEGKRNLLPAYVRALESEIERVGAAGGRPRVDTVFFGGGTPSLLDPRRVERILGRIRDSFFLDA
ncbi:MAG: radical SAM protein, partial [Anaerolineales bacterium]